ncbi:MAG: FAD-dependent oxidoreductase [Oscillospiraceae bacterium]|nr:FAD-dependent oxidoreductase [Oscillospiraceae bacterium]
MVTYIEPAKELPVYHYDVVVAGGGTAGVVAAIASARTGARTALVEAKGYVGGTMLEGGTTLHSYFTLGKYFHRESRQIVKGIAQEIIDRLVAVGGSTGHLEDKLGIDYDEHCTLIDVESVKLVEAEMLEEAGVEIWFNTLVAGADVENGHIRGMIAQSRVEGRIYLEAQSFIDATGWGDLSAYAGADYIVPTEYSIANSVGVAGVDVERYAKYIEENGGLTGITYGPRDGEDGQIVRIGASFWKVLSTLMAAHKKAQGKDPGYTEEELAKNRIPISVQKEMAKLALTLGITTVHENYFMYLKVNYVMKEGLSSQAQMTKAEIELRRRQAAALDLLKKNIPGCEKAFIARSSPTFCTRRGRTIVCEYDISNAEILEGTHFDDDICYFGFHDLAPKYHVGGDGSYGIPLRAILVKGIDNLFAVGMMITTDYDAYMSTRNTVSCMGQGQAAGTLAAMAAKSGLPLRSIPVEALQTRLKADGVYLG